MTMALYEKYYEVKETKVRGVKVAAKEEAIAEKMSRCGYFILMSSHIQDSAEALKIYKILTASCSFSSLP